MSRDWTKKELKAVSKAMKEEGYMSFGEFCKKGKFIYPEETQIENTANAANTTNTAAEVAPMKHLTFTVAECGEYHSAVGTYRDDIATVEEAIDIYRKIDHERVHGIPSIGVRQHIDGEEAWMDRQVDIATGTTIELGYLQYVEPELWADTRIQEAVRKLIEAFPDYTLNRNI